MPSIALSSWARKVVPAAAYFGQHAHHVLVPVGCRDEVWHAIPELVKPPPRSKYSLIGACAQVDDASCTQEIQPHTINAGAPVAAHLPSSVID